MIQVSGSNAHGARSAAATLPGMSFFQRHDLDLLCPVDLTVKRGVPESVLPHGRPGPGSTGQPQGKAESRLHPLGRWRMLSLRGPSPAVPQFSILERLRFFTRGMAESRRRTAREWGRGPSTLVRKSRAGSIVAEQKAFSKPEGKAISMKVTFWGVRGSLPTPLSPEQVRSKIAAVVHRIRPADLESGATRELFLAGLPPELFGTIGGNTTCLEVRTEEGNIIILDGGSGLRDLGVSLGREARPGARVFAVFHPFPLGSPAGDPVLRPGVGEGEHPRLCKPVSIGRAHHPGPDEAAILSR